jgi:hypothetical protein
MTAPVPPLPFVGVALGTGSLLVPALPLGVGRTPPLPAAPLLPVGSGDAAPV